MNRKKSDLSSNQQQLISRYHKVNRLKQLGFTTNWNINDQKPDYDALEDPHASRYFAYRSVKIQLKSLKKSVAKSQKNEKQRQKLNRLIKKKIYSQLPAIKISAKSYNIEQQLLKDGNTFLNHSKHKQLRRDKSKQSQKFQPQNKTMQVIKSKQIKQKEQSKTTELTQKLNDSHHEIKQQNKEIQKNLYLEKSKKKIHQKKHLQFLEFISKKKQQINLSLNLDSKDNQKHIQNKNQQKKIQKPQQSPNQKMNNSLQAQQNNQNISSQKNNQHQSKQIKFQQ